MESLGNRIKKQAEEKRISKTKLAESVGVSRKTLNNIIRGEHDPSVGTIQKIAAFFGLNIHWLITGQGTPHLGPEGQGYHQSFDLSGSKKTKTNMNTVIGSGSIKTGNQAAGSNQTNSSAPALPEGEYIPELLAQISQMSPEQRKNLLIMIKGFKR